MPQCSRTWEVEGVGEGLEPEGRVAFSGHRLGQEGGVVVEVVIGEALEVGTEEADLGEGVVIEEEGEEIEVAGEGLEAGVDTKQ